MLLIEILYKTVIVITISNGYHFINQKPQSKLVI